MEASPFLGRWLLHLEETESTNTLALHHEELLQRDGLIIVSDRQTAGRGRRGRTWCSHIEGNLYCSFILHDRPGKRPLLPYITLIMGIALERTVSSKVQEEVSIKWPNDILICGKKAAGILVETRDMGQYHAMVLGIGVNLRGSPSDFPEDLGPKVTTLEFLTGCPLDKFDFLKNFVLEGNTAILDHMRLGPEATIRRWEEASSSLGRNVRVTDGEHSVEGTILGLSKKGFLLLKTKGGGILEVVSHEVFFL